MVRDMLLNMVVNWKDLFYKLCLYSVVNGEYCFFLSDLD